VIGTGEGRGIGFLFMLLGGFVLLALVAAVAYPRLRRVESELPDEVPDDDEPESLPELAPERAAPAVPELAGE